MGLVYRATWRIHSLPALQLVLSLASLIHKAHPSNNSKIIAFSPLSKLMATSHLKSSRSFKRMQKASFITGVCQQSVPYDHQVLHRGNKEGIWWLCQGSNLRHRGTHLGSIYQLEHLSPAWCMKSQMGLSDLVKDQLSSQELPDKLSVTLWIRLSRWVLVTPSARQHPPSQLPHGAHRETQELRIVTHTVGTSKKIREDICYCVHFSHQFSPTHGCY